MNINNDTYGIIFEECLTAYLAIGGALISVITLLYSLALGKKDELFVLLELIKKGNNDPLILSRRQRLIIHIKSIKRNISISVTLIICSIIGVISSSIGKYANPISTKCVLAVILLLLTVYFVIKTILLLIRLYKQYRKELTF